EVRLEELLLMAAEKTCPHCKEGKMAEIDRQTYNWSNKTYVLLECDRCKLIYIERVPDQKGASPCSCSCGH
ncbi:MAG: hypothetical protein RDV41_15950, partial [Planctomycetota bacterium]|nr:hypothetical protein [Planctomycetota bacterium]